MTSACVFDRLGSFLDGGAQDALGGLSSGVWFDDGGLLDQLFWPPRVTPYLLPQLPKREH